MLATSDTHLFDLASGAPELTRSDGSATGITLRRHLGTAGELSALFLAELDLEKRDPQIFTTAPPRLAVRMLNSHAVWLLQEVHRLDPLRTLTKDAGPYRRLLSREVPSEHVVRFYGRGESVVVVEGSAVTLPWLALERVDGGAAGTTLWSRINACRGGLEPSRATRLVRGILEGVQSLHEVGIIHRNLDPFNVLVAGPIDHETPKLADCGVPQILGSRRTYEYAAAAYSAPEQPAVLSDAEDLLVHGLIGPWTDVYGLASVVWFILGGEDWCLPQRQMEFTIGRRRALGASGHLHPGFRRDPALLLRLDEVLGKAGAACLPSELEATWDAGARWTPGAKRHLDRMRGLGPPARYATVAEFSEDLLPLLDEAAARSVAETATG